MLYLKKLEALMTAKDLKSLISIVFILFLWFILDRFITKSLKRLFVFAEENVGFAVEDNIKIIKRLSTMRLFLIQTVRVLLATIMIPLLFEALGVSVKSFFAGVGMVGLGLSFAAQNLIKDYINGAIILVENQFNIGDWIEIANYSGEVEGFTLRSTKLRDTNGSLVFIPNGQIQTVKNSTKKWAFAVIKMSLSYETDITKVDTIVKNIVKAMREEVNTFIMDDPQVYSINELTLNSVDIIVKIKTEPGKQWVVEREFRTKIKELFAKENIHFAGQRIFLKNI
ncbi:MAG: mechanosensitive ion channel family protein [Synergistaceae bacterium]